ncbi:hypothetical protein G6O67_006178 [Ophiocordyceps sinensis]|uniref:Uncharacterized protein n=1 Tax=Ophiocordyceps sinensis TaxID=72228 RepID=A0A8H4LVQ3_9HYPO|nr:hypothetical protein G6O67_006178 [Ophiocordyceps sinensis]
MSHDESDQYDPNFEKRQIAWQWDCTVSLIQPGVVLKQGAKVRPSEEKAMLLVHGHTPDVPVPLVRRSYFRFKDGVCGNKG